MSILGKNNSLLVHKKMDGSKDDLARFSRDVRRVWRDFTLSDLHGSRSELPSFEILDVKHI